MKNIHFTKMHGLGNDFMVINTIEHPFTLQPEMIKQLADRHRGVGFDQLMIITKPTQPECDFGYRIFNADGTEVQQCGNGVRCVAQFIHEKKLSVKTTLKLATPFLAIECQILGNQLVKVAMGKANFSPASLPFMTPTQASYYELFFYDRLLSFGAVSIGNPHVIFVVPDIAQAEVDTLGTFFNQHLNFPQGVNVEFMQILDANHIQLRVYERGAGETLACGTGACAAVSMGKEWGMLSNEVSVNLPGGQLFIECDKNSNIHMIGPAVSVFDGKLC